MKRIVTLVLAFALVLALGSIALAGSGTFYGEDYEWDLAETSPKTWYVGETVNDADITLSNVKRSGSTISTVTHEVVTDTATVELPADVLEGKDTVSVKLTDTDTGYGFLTTDYVSVKVARKLDKIEVTEYPEKAYYNETLSDYTIVVKATFEDGTEAYVSNEVTFSKDIFDVEGTITITASYTLGGITKTADFNVVVEKYLQSLTVVHIGDVYVEDETRKGLTVTANYVDGKTKDVTDDVTLNPTTYTTPGTQTVNVDYEEDGVKVTSSFSTNPVYYLQSITTNLIGDVYVDDKTTKGLTVIANYADGKTKDVTEDENVTLSPATYTAPGSTTVTVTYTEGGTTETDTFTATPVSFIKTMTVTELPTEARVGDKPTAKVVVEYADGTIADVSDKVTFDPKVYDTVNPAQTVKVTYKYSEHNEQTMTAAGAVNVKAQPALTVTSAYDKASGKIVVYGDPLVDKNGDDVFSVMFDGAPLTSGEYTMKPNVKNFNEIGEQVFSFAYHDKETGKDYEAACTIDVVDPIDSFEVTGDPDENFAGKKFDAEEMDGSLQYEVKFNKSDITGKKLEEDFTSSDFSKDCIGWTTPTLKFGVLNNEITFTYTHPTMSHAFYFKKLVSGLSWVDSVIVTGSPMLFDGYTFRDCLLRSIDKGLVKITVKFVPQAQKDDIVIISSKDAMLTRFDIPNTKLEGGVGISEVITFTDNETKTIAKSAAIIGTPEAMRYYSTGTAKTTAPQWKGSVKKTSYSEGQEFDPTGLKLVLTNFFGVKEVITTGFKYTYLKKSGNTWVTDGEKTERALRKTDKRVRVHYEFTDLDGATLDAWAVALNQSGKDKRFSTTISVKTRTLSKLQITQQPDKVKYEVGEKFDATGMIVLAVYGNGTKEVVNAYTYEPNEAFTKEDIGTNVILVSYTAGTVTKTAHVTVTVNGPAVPSMSVVLDKTSLSLVETQTAVLEATVFPLNASNKKVTWTSSNETVATVSEKGVVEAVGAGTCLITATTCDYTHRYADCYVYVEPKTEVKKLKLEYSSLELLKGDATTIAWKVEPENATITEIAWETSDATVVDINVDGQIKGLKLGTAVVTGTVNDVSASVVVTVVNKLTSTGTVYNCKKSVNVRASASNSGTVIGSASKGKKFKVLDKSGSWYKIQYTTTKTGWIYKDYLKISDKSYNIDVEDSDNTTATTATSGTVYASKLTIVNCTRYCYVRKGPSTATSSIGHATANTTYDLLGVSGDWYIINFEGQQGYIYKTFAKLS